MPAFLYRCPTTRLHVQGWAPDDEAEGAGDVYEDIACLACGGVHFVNSKTGKLMGEESSK
jgi:hypothetical protein